MNVIEIDKLKKYYGHKRGLEEATISVQENEIFGFVGPNGAGKTTLIRTLLGLIEKTSGDIRIYQKPIDVGSFEANDSIGYLPSEAYFFPEMKVSEVISFYQSMRRASEERIQRLVDLFGLDLTKKVNELSFGNKKKLAIVVAFMSQPKLYILDEPTTGLDPLMQQIFLGLLLEEKQNGATIFLSSHVLSEVEKICDRVALIRDGKINFVFRMDEMNPKNHKRIQLSPSRDFSTYPEFTLTNEQSNQQTYDYVGDINHLIQVLSNYQFDSLSIRDTSLEELVLKYYQKEV